MPDKCQAEESELEHGLNETTEDADGLVVWSDLTPGAGQPEHTRGDGDVIGDLELIPQLHGVVTIIGGPFVLVGHEGGLTDGKAEVVAL